MEKDNCEMDQEQIMLQEFREAAFKYLVFLETQFSCKDIEAFEDASYSAPIDKSKIFKVIEPKKEMHDIDKPITLEDLTNPDKK